MIKYRLHNVSDIGEDLQYFYTEKALNNYISLYVKPPYWIENLYTNKNIYVGFDGQSYASPSDGIKDYIETVSSNKLDVENVSRETLHGSEIDWIKKHAKESYTKAEKVTFFLCILTVINIVTFLLYLFLSLCHS